MLGQIDEESKVSLRGKFVRSLNDLSEGRALFHSGSSSVALCGQERI
jgi:hypothetical protein